MAMSRLEGTEPPEKPRPEKRTDPLGYLKDDDPGYDAEDDPGYDTTDTGGYQTDDDVAPERSERYSDEEDHGLPM